jgi:hypothetical protein
MAEEPLHFPINSKTKRNAIPFLQVIRRDFITNEIQSKLHFLASPNLQQHDLDQLAQVGII